MANALSGQNIYEIEGITDIEYPVKLNAFIIVMKNGKKYFIEITEYSAND